MFHLVLPDADNRGEFIRLTPPRFRPFLWSDPARPGAGAPGALALGAACGTGGLSALLIGFPNDKREGSFSLRHLWVHPASRGLEVEGSLLAQAERLVRERGFLQMEMDLYFFTRTRMMYSLAEAPAMRALLEELGWDAIRLDRTSFYIEEDRGIEKERWFRLEVPDGYELFLWKDLREPDRAALGGLRGESQEAGEPFHDPLAVEPFDPHTSLGLRRARDGRVAGWLVNEALPEERVRVRRLYLMPEERNQGLFFPLLSNSIRLCLERRTPATFDVLADNPKMRNAVMLMMEHLCDAITDKYYCHKALRPGDGGA